MRRYCGSIFGRKFTSKTRKDGGSGTGLIVTFDDCSEIPSNFVSKFLSKTNLNKHVTNNFLPKDKQSILRVTFGDFILSKE